MANLISFTFQDNKVRTLIDEQENIWFCRKDILDILGLRLNTKLLNSLNPKGIAKSGPLSTAGGKQQLIFINEPNLYRVIFKSEKPQAKEFQDWVFEEVLPAIRKQGSYIKEHEDLKFDVKKPWYVEQLLELCQRHNMTQIAIKKVIDITERAWKQGYAVAMAKVEKEQAEHGSNKNNSDNSSVAVPFSTVLNMLTTASYITDRFQYYVETSQLINDVMQRLEIVLNDTRGLAAMADMSMPMIKGCLKQLEYTEEQKKEVDRVLSPYGKRICDKEAA